MYTNDTPIWQLTVGEFKELCRTIRPEPVKERHSESRRIVYGIKGIAELFDCSMTTAQQIKNSGIIDKAVSQVGRTIAIDAEKALELTAGTAKRRR